MSIKSNGILLGSFLLIFLFLIGMVAATEDINDYNLTSEDSVAVDNQLNIENIVEESNLDNSGENDDLKTNGENNEEYSGEIFLNPNFEEGDTDSEIISGWITQSIDIKNGKYELEELNPKNFYIESNFERIQNNNILLQYDGRTLHIDKPDDDSALVLGQYINFDSIDSISFMYVSSYVLPMANANMACKFDIRMDDDVVMNVVSTERCNHWSSITINTTEFSGIHFFNLYLTKDIKNRINLENFTTSYNGKVGSFFENSLEVNKNNISVQFNNRATGLIKNIFWDFGDGTNSTEISPKHDYVPGNYKATLTVSNENNTASYEVDLSLNYPTINGQMYSTVQDAIDNAEANAVIDVPSDFAENLNIKQNLTLNFNGNKLNGNINVNDGAIVTVTNISDVSSVATDDSSKLTITDSNINSNLELKAGNIDVNSVNFNDSVLTITSANATLVNVNVANGGIVVNGGKSKITNSNLTGSNVAITQTAGELEITNNIIKDNVKGIEITGGNATITFNAIYNNTNALNSTNANVISKNNWYGTKTVTGTDSYLTMSITTDAVKMYPGEKYTITVDLTQNNNGESTLSEGSLSAFTLEFTSPNGVTTPVTINNGKGTFEFTSGAISEDVKLTLFGEEYELEDTSIVTKPIETNITITSSEKGVVVICLTTADGNVSGASVKYIINGVNSTNVTDANGQIIINGLSGKITINATFEGNETLLASNMVNSFDFTEPTVDNKTNSTQPTVNPSKTPTSTKIVKVASKITAKKKTFKAKTKTKKYQITLKTKSGKAIKKVKVTLKVKGKTYKATTNSKGKATFKITKLTKKGKYTAVIKFAGNKNYKATSKKVKLSVKK